MSSSTRNVSTEGFWPLQGEAFIQLFGKYIDFAVEDAATIDYVERCVEYLNAVDDNLLDSLCLACIRYHDSMIEMVGGEPKLFSTPRDILLHVCPSTLLIPNPENGSEPVARLELNCDWEIEHGMEWVIRGNSILYVGAFNDLDPFGDFSKMSCSNYA
jgi:hypothetical protein